MQRISILTPSYNQAGYLRRTIESVLTQQGDFEIELIVIDGGSTDDTVDVLKSYGDRIRWVSEADEGQADALNKGMKLATGEIIGWVNSDDFYYDAAFNTVMDIFARESKTQWVYGKVRIVDPADREIRKWITAYKNMKLRRYSYPSLLVENWISQMGVFWRRSFGDRVGPFRKDLHFCMDYNYWLRMGALAPGRYVDQYLAAFRWYPQSKSGASFSRQFREELEVAREIAAGRYPFSMLRHRVTYAKIVAVYSIMRLFGRLSRTAA